MLEFKKIKPSETLHFNPPIQIQDHWMIGLLSLDVYNTFFNTKEKNEKFELYIS